jgi:hypothetical protein
MDACCRAQLQQWLVLLQQQQQRARAEHAQRAS